MAKKDTKSLYDRVQQNLKEIKSVPDYKTMCKILEEYNYDRKASKSNNPYKKKQIEYWKMCFKWTTRKGSFTNIKIYSEEEYYANVLKQLSKEFGVYALCSFLNLYSQYTDGAICYMTKQDIATAICLCNEDFKDFQRNRISYGESLENYTLNLQEEYDFIKEPKKEIYKNIETPSDNTITRRTYHIVNDYGLHVSENNGYFIESLLKQLTDKRVIKSRDTFIGGYVDMSKIPITADLSDIYQENNNFYLKLKNSDPLLIPYKEAAMTSDEINEFIKLQGDVIHSMGYSDYPAVKNANRVQELHDRLLPLLFQRLKVVFVYQAYEMFISPSLTKDKSGIYKQSLDSFLNTFKLKKALVAINEDNQEKILSLKEKRQKKEDTINTKNKMVKSNKEIIYSLDKDKEKDNLNKQYALLMYKQLNKQLIQVDWNTFLPENNTLDSLENCPKLWQKLFDKSKSKADNTKRPETSN